MPLYAVSGLRPSLGNRVWLAPTATVIGDVILGDDSSVWFGAVLRGDVCPIRIGARTNIQDNAVVHVTHGTHATHMGDDVTVGHLAVVHGATIGNRCLIGMGSVVLDGAVVEDEAFVAAGALVPPNMRVPSRSLVAGRPARKVRDLSDAELATMFSAATQYVQYAGEFSRTLETVSALEVAATSEAQG